jgi:hypothetical protein
LTVIAETSTKAMSQSKRYVSMFAKSQYPTRSRYCSVVLKRHRTFDDETLNV